MLMPTGCNAEIATSTAIGGAATATGDGEFISAPIG